jgi:hypothetical protein
MKEYTFWRDIYTGEIFPEDKDWMPKFGGYEPVHESTYIAYLKAHPNYPDLRD